jgi:hypothetical protein
MNQQANNNFMNKRKNDFGSNTNGLKKGRFNPNNNNMSGDSFDNSTADQQQPPFMNHNSNQSNNNDQASNEWYQDNFNSNQWI